MRRYLTDVDLSRNQLKNARVHNTDTPPANPAESQIYYDTREKVIKVFNGLSWDTIPNQDYVDTLQQGLDFKESVRAATTSDIDLTVGGLVTVDGVSLINGDRVLVKNQVNPAENGVYIVSSGTWERAEDAGYDKITSGMFVFVSEGDTYSSSGFVLATHDPITVGETDLEFVRFSGAGQIIAGEGLYKDYNTLLVVSHEGDPSNVGTLTVTGDSIGVTLGNTAITAAPGNHVHNDLYHTQLELGSTEDENSGASLIGTSNITGVDGSTVQSNLESLKELIDGKTEIGHIHNIADTANLQEELDNKSSVDHLHDNRYFTEAELSSTLEGESGASKIGSTSIAGITGTNVQTQLQNLKQLVDDVTVKKSAITIGDGANTEFEVVHNLNTMDVTVLIRENAEPYRVVYADMYVMNVNSIQVQFSAPPSDSQYRVIVTG